ncbi:hypothetical protein F4802DRAFT_597366 [Xylaria palmicola]|nr:hypothetical protein F4802DRAFT_597366 [Xylaria palmicola]
MSASTSSIAYFDRLPDELLLLILNHAMEQRTPPFFPEYCVQTVRESCTGQKSTDAPLSSQSAHLKDWRGISMTSRRIRGLGREAFFGAKTIAMTSSFPERLRKGTFAAFGGPSDQELALRSIRSIILVDVVAYSPSVFILLPKILRLFPKLGETVILFGYRRHEPVQLISEAGRVDTPIELQHLLGGIGLTSELMPEIAVCKELRWSEIRGALTRTVYPMLKAKADMMAKIKRKNEREDDV